MTGPSAYTAYPADCTGIQFVAERSRTGNDVPTLAPLTAAKQTRAGSPRTQHVLRSLRDDCVTRLFQKREYLFAADTGIVLQKVLDRIAALEKVDQRINRHSSANEHGSAAEDLRV